MRWFNTNWKSIGEYEQKEHEYTNYYNNRNVIWTHQIDNIRQHLMFILSNFLIFLKHF